MSSRQHILTGLTCIPHGAEDALGDGHDGVRGLVVAPDRLAPGCVLTHVLQEVFQGLTHHAGCCAHLQDKSRSSIVNLSIESHYRCQGGLCDSLHLSAWLFPKELKDINRQ